MSYMYMYNPGLNTMTIRTNKYLGSEKAWREGRIKREGEEGRKRGKKGGREGEREGGRKGGREDER